MVQEIRSLQKLAIFFQGLTLGAEGGGGLYAVLYGTFFVSVTLVSSVEHLTFWHITYIWLSMMYYQKNNK